MERLPCCLQAGASSGKLSATFRIFPMHRGWVPALEFLFDTPVDPGGPVSGLHSGSRGVPGGLHLHYYPLSPGPPGKLQKPKAQVVLSI